MGIFSIFKKKEQQVEQTDALNSGLERSREGLFSKLSRAIVGKSKVDDEVLDNLEEVLLSSDVGVDTTLKIIKAIEGRVSRDKYIGTEELNKILREEVGALLLKKSSAEDENWGERKDGMPFVIMIVGVNGVGKTTTIGKLASRLQNEGKRVFIGAADTFRAAAIDQIEVWAERSGARLIKQQMGSDPASVAYDTLQAATAAKADVVLIDTAGRLHNKVGLMGELTKIKNVMHKVIPGAPHEVMLILDGSTGQNAFEQAKQFSAATQITSLSITKLDGTARGGVVVGISDTMGIPVRFIGVGEKVSDLQAFDAETFVESLFG